MADIVVLGSLNADLVVTADRAPRGGETVVGDGFCVFNGGKGANQAFAAAQLGGDVAMLGRVGADDYGRALKDGLAGAGVDVEGIRCIEDVTTGVAVITVEANGENRIVVVPGANGEYSVAELERDRRLFAGTKVALFQLETPLETVAKGLSIARESGCITILDPAPARTLSAEVLSLVDFLTPNLSELSVLSACSLSGESSEAEIVSAAQSLLEFGVGTVIAKLGSRGALLVNRSGAHRIYAASVAAVDSTGAGDCFNGAFAAAFSRGVDLVESTRMACLAASVSVTRRGAQSSFPSLEEVVGGGRNEA